MYMTNGVANKEQVNALKLEIERLIDLVWRDRNIRSRRKHLSRLRSDVGALTETCSILLSYSESFHSGQAALDAPVTSQQTFTQADLAQYDGKSGNPAYVAVNGVVYDVTNNAAWAAATHFGLSAGNDLTSQFSCHAGQQILQNLIIVGNLTNG